jgi:hypothetical protein
MMLILAGCATVREWEIWQAHPTHFASDDHLYFSVRNREETAPQVTRHDIARARVEGWWGRPVTVSQEHILER